MRFLEDRFCLGGATCMGGGVVVSFWVEVEGRSRFFLYARSRMWRYVVYSQCKCMVYKDR